VSSLRATHRWCLTGTPIQNRVDDLGSLLGFLRAYPFDELTKFRTIISESVENKDAEGYERLGRLFRAVSLRRVKDMESVELHLPKRHEVTRLVELDPKEKELYNLIKKSSGSARATGSGRGILQVILRLRQISNHGPDLLPLELLKRLESAGISGPLSSLLEIQCCEGCKSPINEGGDTSERALGCGHQLCDVCLPPVEDEGDEFDLVCPICSGGTLRPGKKAPTTGRVSAKGYRTSTKVRALLAQLDLDKIRALGANEEQPKR